MQDRGVFAVQVLGQDLRGGPVEVGIAAVRLVHVVDDVRRARVVIEDQLQVRVQVEDLADRGV